MPKSDPFAAPIRISKPLSGVTLLLVEDSRYCSEAVRLMALRSGARLRRADSIASARRHLAIYRPDAVIVDIGLPDGSGLDLLADLHALGEDCPAVLVVSGEAAASEDQALRAGADGFLAKPVADLVAFQRAMEQVLKRNTGLVRLDVPAAAMDLDDQALMDDLGRITQMLEKALPAGDPTQLRYCAQFVSSIAQTAQDGELADGASRFFRRMNTGDGQVAGRAVLDLLRDRLRSRDDGEAMSGVA